MKRSDKLKILGYILLIEIVGSIGALATTPAIPTWYAGLNKPFFNPPNWIFGPVWTLLFALLGYNLYLLNKSKKKEAKAVIETFWRQMILNVLWSFLFFGLNNPLLGLVGILVLLYYIFKLYKQSQKADKLAAKLLIPYIAWVSFAAILNFSILVLN